MAQELLMYIVVVMLAGSLSLFLCVYAFFKMKDAPGAKYYILVTLMSTIFTFAYCFELASISIEQMKFWLSIEYLAMPFIPVLILLMCLDYVGHKINQWIYYLLFATPIITIFMHNTNDLHHLYYTSMEVRNDTPFPILQLEGGPWFYVHSMFLFVCIMLSVIILLMQLKKSLFRFRMQVLTMVAGLIIPLIANHFYINGMSPYGIDLGPVSMSITFLLHFVALVSYQMFNVSPIARDKVFENMKEGVIVLNQNKVIVDYNNAIQTVIPQFKKHVIGRSIEEVLSDNQKLYQIIRQEKQIDFDMDVEKRLLHYQIRFTSLVNKSNLHIGQIITFSDVTERVNTQEQLQKLASIDGLTLVYNRTFFMKNSEKTLDELAIKGGDLSVIMFDIDLFKTVNDTYGHETGDRVLTHVAHVAKQNLRETDIIGRYGGEEFIICLPDTSLSMAYDIANTLRKKISESSIKINTREILVTSSFGVASSLVTRADDRQIIQRLMEQADQALYVAKRNGRNCVYSYSPVLQYVK
ncbi:histidine kinase N-terminal 7TM domain-containing diguanylate cyclase [Sutcliffiella halmapala]|uniref:histidine kinase N-terminal 7TM domain-containing diguanylate cyclase n=1 Tax=Sutcliffiella halmapala TaxID=79882 RepID=UPI000995788C|nr:histidine kinase N-terminal 7TM domain-containing protein [Sutcliffiella halmapala]